MGRLIDNARVTKVRVFEDRVETDTRADRLAVEEPLQIRVDGTDLTTTMRTPGHDVELAHGLLHAEGVIRSFEDVVTARYCAGAVEIGDSGMRENTYNTLDIALERHEVHDLSATDSTVIDPLPVLPIRNVTTTNSSCGVCGTTSIDDLMKTSRFTIRQVRPTAREVVGMPRLLAEGQKAFRKTGGIHAAGAFTADGRPLVIREDVGRHNAADKVIGSLLLEGRLPGDVLQRDPEDPDAAVYLVMSSRASFELVQKAVLAGFSGLIAVSAATSLAVRMAREAGLLLTGFTRDDRVNLYSGEFSEE